MKGRVLALAATAGPATSRRWKSLRLAFAAGAVALVVAANVSDRARTVRIAGGRPAVSSPVDAGALAQRMRLTRELLASADPWDEGTKGSDQL